MATFNQLSGFNVDGLVQSSYQGVFIGSATVMPTASTALNGVIVLFTGATGTYEQNTFYMCDGSAWNQINIIPDYGLTPNSVVIVGADGSIQASAVSTTELGYLSGVTSGIQAQFTALGGQISTAEGNITTLQGQMQTAQQDISSLEGDVSALDTNKQDVITGGATTIVSDNLTINSALVSDGIGKVAVSPVTSAELAFVQGATSNIQNQLNTLASQIASMSGFQAQVVAELPATGEPNIMYFVPSSSAGEQNIYDEFLYVNGAWEHVGSTAFTLDIQQNASGITINGTALQDASSTQDGLMTSTQVNALTEAGNNIGTLQGQMSTAEGNISTLQGQQSTMDTRISTNEGNISTLQGQIPNLVPYSGGTMTGQLVAQSNTNYTTAQVRNVIMSPDAPSDDQGNDGDIWIQYSE